MLNTSQLYKDLFSQGAIEEYKIVVDDTEYLQDSIYDTIGVKQQLFSTDTFNVGGFALSTLEVKLKVPTISIPRNAFIKFYYRLTNGDENSEWIPKFSGRVVKRRRLTDDVTTIEALSKGANYDVFLDVFPDATDIYPADNREIANLCATHLGLPIENITEIYDGNNVEYPNEETVISVLQYIAALSGGNWIITEDDNLRLVVLNKTITDIPKYSAFNIVSEEEKPPISKVTMYYQDSKAFTSGDDTGSELIIDCPWATQDATDYVLSLYQGYVYKPMQGVGVSIDGALQLGDSFEYDNNEIQLATKIDYEFAGALVANVDAPTNVEDGYDDPWNDLVKAPLRRKVTLGDAYQGVTISREFGIEMLLSPTGKEEDAIAKYYADLNKGMAFQYRESPDDEWEDWLYFDTQEKRFKLMLQSGEGDINDRIVIIEANLDKISAEVENIHLGNIIPNANAREGYIGWTGDGRTLYTQRMIDVGYEEGFTYGVVAEPKIIQGAMSESGWDFYSNSGSMYSPVGYVARPGEQYGFRARVDNFKPVEVTVLEYEEITTTTPTKETLYTLSSPQQYVTFEHTMQSNTKYSGLKIKVPTVSFTDRTSLSDIMFNIGYPKEWFESAGDVAIYSKSLFEQLSNQIDLQTTEIDRVNGAIHNAGVEINARDGITTYGEKFEVKSADRTQTYMSVTNNGLVVNNAEITGGSLKVGSRFEVTTAGDLIANNAKLNNAEITGNLNAGKIAGLNFNNSKITFPNGNLALNSATDSIDFGSTKMQFSRMSYGSYFSDNIDIKTTNGTIRFGEYSLETGAPPGTFIGGVDMIQVPTIVGHSAYGLQLGSIHMMPIYVGGPLLPNQTNSRSLGNSTLRFQNAYLNNQPNVSSDSRYKRNILPIDDKLIEIFGKEVEPRTYTMRDNNEIHFGYIAQDVERALYKYTLSKYGLNEAKNVVSEFAVLSKSESYMSLLYGEIAVIMDAYNRMRNQELEDRIKKLEERYNVS